MARYKVLGGEWAEGYVVGQEINIDEEAAHGRVSVGELELVETASPEFVEPKVGNEPVIPEVLPPVEEEVSGETSPEAPVSSEPAVEPGEPLKTK